MTPPQHFASASNYVTYSDILALRLSKALPLSVLRLCKQAPSGSIQPSVFRHCIMHQPGSKQRPSIPLPAFLSSRTTYHDDKLHRTDTHTERFGTTHGCSGGGARSQGHSVVTRVPLGIRHYRRSPRWAIQAPTCRPVVGTPPGGAVGGGCRAASTGPPHSYDLCPTTRLLPYYRDAPPA